MLDELARRAHPHLRDLWHPMYLVQLERMWWTDVMQIQLSLGAKIPPDAIAASQHATIDVDLDTMLRIEERERKTRHDLKARLEIFCEDAGHEFHHLGMTSADVVENVYQIRVLRSMEFLEKEWSGIRMPSPYPLRGIKGPVGTQSDQVDLLGSVEAADQLDRALANRYGFETVIGSVGQVMIRSIDHQVVTQLLSDALRFSKGPGRPLCAVLSGFAAMTAAIAGDTWLEGDVASSVVRRVALPGALFAFDVAMRGWQD